MDTANLSVEEKFILNAIKTQGESAKKMAYKKLQEICANEFEGVRLILKKLKDKGLVRYDGAIPGFSSEIELSEL